MQPRGSRTSDDRRNTGADSPETPDRALPGPSGGGISRREALRRLFVGATGIAGTAALTSLPGARAAFAQSSSIPGLPAMPVPPGSAGIAGPNPPPPSFPLGSGTGAPEDAGDDAVSVRGHGIGDATGADAAPVGTVPVDDYPMTTGFPFAHGVASGDPLQDRVIIWTRVTLPERDPGGDPGANPAGSVIPVRWEVATDPGMRDRVASGVQDAVADHDWTVKVDVTGLAPGTTYYYRFRHGSDVSVVGRARTAASAGVDQMRMAVLSCSSYWSSWWSGMGHLAARDDLDLVVHLGDYLYDFVDKDETVRSRVGFDDLAHPDNRDWLNLAEIRRRYALWRSDPNFARAHQQHSWTIVWDNHDIDPFYGNQLAVPEVGVEETVTIQDAFRAFWEWTPSRPVHADGSGQWLLVDDGSYPAPEDPALIYRSLNYGDLVDVFAMDAQSLLPKYGLPVDSAHMGGEPSLLGRRQFEWLAAGLDRSESSGTLWKVLAQQSWFSPTDLPDVIPGQTGPKFGTSRWSGYVAEKSAIVDMMRDRVANAVLVSGDAHGNLGSDVLSTAVVGDGYSSGLPGANPRHGAEAGNVNAGAVRLTTGNIGRRNARAFSAGVEFCPTSMGRGGADDAIRGALDDAAGGAGADSGSAGAAGATGSAAAGRPAVIGATRIAETALLNMNSNVQFLEWADHGYGIVHFERTRAIFEYWWQDKNVQGAPDVLGHQMVAWAHDDPDRAVPRYRDQIDAVFLHGLPVEPTVGTRVAAPAPEGF